MHYADQFFLWSCIRLIFSLHEFPVCPPSVTRLFWVTSDADEEKGRENCVWQSAGGKVRRLGCLWSISSLLSLFGTGEWLKGLLAINQVGWLGIRKKSGRRQGGGGAPTVRCINKDFSSFLEWRRRRKSDHSVTKCSVFVGKFPQNFNSEISLFSENDLIKPGNPNWGPQKFPFLLFPASPFQLIPPSCSCLMRENEEEGGKGKGKNKLWSETQRRKKGEKEEERDFVLLLLPFTG